MSFFLDFAEFVCTLSSSQYVLCESVRVRFAGNSNYNPNPIEVGMLWKIKTEYNDLHIPYSKTICLMLKRINFIVSHFKSLGKLRKEHLFGAFHNWTG